MSRYSQGEIRSGERGFTLLEVIIALAIMTLAFASILTVESGSINASIRAKQMNIVAMLAKNTMTELEHQFEGKPFDEVKKEESGVFEAPFQDYRWTSNIKEIKLPNLSVSPEGSGGKKQESIAGGDIAQLMTKLVTNFLSKAIREVTVTVHWKRGSGEQKFSVSTYWVDLNHEFQLSE